MSIDRRLSDLEKQQDRRARSELEALADCMRVLATPAEWSAYWRWIAAAIAGGDVIADPATWGGAEAVSQWLADHAGYEEDRDAPVLAELAARLPADVKRKGLEAWLHAGVSEEQLDWLE